METKRQSSNDSSRSFCEPLPNGIAECNGSLSVTSQLRRSLSLWDVMLFGVGCSVGAGIYSLVGIGAELAGPAVALSFLLCGTACIFTSLCYAEFAARVPVAGSAYTYAYISFGEMIGWLVGWNLTLGYGVSSAVVARSWAEYLVDFLRSFGVERTSLTLLTHFPLPILGDEYTCSPLSMVIVGLCTLILVTGAKESTTFNSVMTLVNLSVLTLVMLAGSGSGSIESDNLTPFMSNGFSGVAQAAGLVFFAYLGFDMVACLSEEVENPQRNVPLGIVGSLLISISVYLSTSVIVVGMAPINLLGEDVPVVNALLANACCTHEEQLSSRAEDNCLSAVCSPLINPLLSYCSRIVSFGAMFGLTTATFTCLMGQPRIFYRMAKDGLLFEVFGEVDEKTKVPTTGTVVTGVLVAVVACLVELKPLADMISLGTLQVFTFVNAGVIFLRVRQSHQNVSMSAQIDTTPLDESAPFIHEDVAARNGIDNRKVPSTRVPFSITENNASYGGGSIRYIVIFTLSVLAGSFAWCNGWHITVSVACGILALAAAVTLFFMPKCDPPDTFCCPLVPAVPLLGIGCNAVMMGSMPILTWVSIFFWLLGGLAVYLGYGMHHSKHRRHGESGYDSFSMTPVSSCRDDSVDYYGTLS